jgi:Conserved TM helix
MTTPITDWGASIYTSLAGALALLFSAVPRIIGFVLIMLIGWFIANLIRAQ